MKMYVFYILFTCLLPIWMCISENISTSRVSREAAIKIFFSNSGKKDASSSLERGLVALIDSAEKSFDGAFYELSSEKVANRLIALHERGVKVRLVMEADSKTNHIVQRLLSAGIPIVFDDSEGLMHNKFAIVDGEVVWTGSYNPVASAEHSDNNAVLIYSCVLAEIFGAEFRDMFEKKLFGTARRGVPFDRLIALTPISVHGIAVRAFFSPRHGIESILAELIRTASSRVHFMAFSFTSELIGDSLIGLVRRGVAVHGIMEERGALTAFSEYMKLKVEGIDVRIRRGRGVMHHKVIVIDERIVITGSFNFSRGADSINDENIVIIESEEVARAYINEFNRVQARSG